MNTFSKINTNVLGKHANKIVFLITVIALCFYSVRLRYTTEIASDFGRDTLKSLELWQNKQVTFLGSPLALDALPGKTVFFTSLSLYVGMVGLLVSGFSPIGPVVPTITLIIVSISFFYRLAQRFFKKETYALFATCIYALSPLTVYYARIFWTPNTLIPLSVFFWYLATMESKWSKIGAGIVAGVMFHIHYMAIVPIVMYLLVIGLKREVRQCVLISIGLVIGLVPFLLFEIRNHFFLTSSLITNILSGNASTGTVDTGSLLFRLTTFFGSLFGFRSAELSYDNFLGSVPYLREVLLAITIMLMVYEMVRTVFDKDRSPFTLTIVLSMGWVLITRNSINIRYLFSIYAILVLYGASMLLRAKSRALMIVFSVFMVATSYMVVSRTVTTTNYSIPVVVLERAGQIIVEDDFRGTYNVMETVTGDAQATSLRFFVMRDAIHKPLGQGAYSHLDGLYVMARNDQEALGCTRWEFLVNPTLQLEEKWSAGEVIVYKFLRH